MPQLPQPVLTLLSAGAQLLPPVLAFLSAVTFLMATLADAPQSQALAQSITQAALLAQRAAAALALEQPDPGN